VRHSSPNKRNADILLKEEVEMVKKANATKCVVSLVFLVILSSPLAHATVLRRLSLDELVSHADTIVVGKCEKTETVWLARKIYTIATVHVSKSVKGKVDPNSTIKVYVLGGRVRKPMPVKMHVPGAAKVAPSEEMLLFLKPGGVKKRHHRFVGMSQGKIPIRTDPKTGRKKISYRQLIKGVRWVGRDGKPFKPDTPPKPIQPGGFEGFLGRIKQIMSEQEAKAKKAAAQNNQQEDAQQNKEGGAK
jgi:hypothetical protein